MHVRCTCTKSSSHQKHQRAPAQPPIPIQRRHRCETDTIKRYTSSTQCEHSGSIIPHILCWRLVGGGACSAFCIYSPIQQGGYKAAHNCTPHCTHRTPLHAHVGGAGCLCAIVFGLRHCWVVASWIPARTVLINKYICVDIYTNVCVELIIDKSTRIR